MDIPAGACVPPPLNARPIARVASMVRDLIGPTAAMANVCVSLEADASTLGSDEEMSSFLKEYGMTVTGLS